MLAIHVGNKSWENVPAAGTCRNYSYMMYGSIPPVPGSSTVVYQVRIHCTGKSLLVHVVYKIITNLSGLTTGYFKRDRFHHILARNVSNRPSSTSATAPSCISRCLLYPHFLSAPDLHSTRKYLRLYRTCALYDSRCKFRLLYPRLS